MKLVVGLGNPGMEYIESRHNVGFMVVDKIAAFLKISVKNFMCKSLVGESKAENRRLILAKPVTFMNLSGDAVGLLLERYNLEPAEMIIIYDDMDLDLGRLRIRPKGGHGGHKGIRSIIEAVGTNEFPRLRIGIGRPPGDPVNYVLSSFSAEELVVMKQSIEKACCAVLCASKMGLCTAMNRYNS